MKKSWIDIKTIMLFSAVSTFSFMTHAHVVLAQPQVKSGAYYTATFKVGHGCEGSPTTALQVLLPEGIQGAKPMPKVGWQIEAQPQPLAKPYVSHGKTVTEGLTQITWKEGSLPDAYYDEFTMQFQVTAEKGPLWFKVQQRCEKGSNLWVEIPSQGTSTKGLNFPAALLMVEPSENHSHTGHGADAHKGH
jgi:uncharacterized protein YcnI